MSKQVEALRKLGLTDAEIEQVLADDKRIDKGEKLFELTTEQEKASKQARKAGWGACRSSAAASALGHDCCHYYLHYHRDLRHL